MGSDADEWNDPPAVREDDQDTERETQTVGIELGATLACALLLAVPAFHDSVTAALAAPAVVALTATAWRWAVAYERRGRGGDGA